MNLPARIAAAATAGLLAAMTVAPGAAALDHSAEPEAAAGEQQVVFEDICSGVLVRLSNAPTADPVTFEVNGEAYQFPSGLAPEPLLVGVGVVGVVVAETGEQWLHIWTAPTGCSEVPQPCEWGVFITDR
jgi:hypothetical protein